MKNLLLVFLLLLIFNDASGQGFEKLSYNDSLRLVDAWVKFKKTLENKNLKTLKTLSLRIVDCDIFQTPDPYHDVSPYISIDTFSKQFFQHMSNSKLWSVVKTKKYRLHVEKQINYSPEFNKKQNGLPILLFEVWFITWEPNELAKGHEGQSHAFEFVKIGNSLKFYGMTSIP
jgi:hypothetical protein